MHSGSSRGGACSKKMMLSSTTCSTRSSCILHNICHELQEEFLYEWIKGVVLDTDDTAVFTAADSSDARHLLVYWCAVN
ncbi:hypothetical protein JTE90_013394 [Oedothorax gibbosus]|uniref:Uncharacterized protein n=1 Tax=Oedothorax gibbosus TaxID=931172 RepID=A0AAV6TVS6_9ARAC|nr:hypothetical protein JTE90_013394 [Oedothorax gibbosus]